LARDSLVSWRRGDAVADSI